MMLLKDLAMGVFGLPLVDFKEKPNPLLDFCR